MTSEAEVASSSASAACDFPTAVQTAIIIFSAASVSAPCIVVSAGDLVTWQNPTTDPITIRTDDDQFYAEDVSAGFSTVEIPVRGQVKVRLIHAGRVVYAAPDHPSISGTILVLGRGAA